MATSGTFNFSMTNNDVVQEAYEISGFEARTAYDAETARSSMNLIFRDWANHGVNLWTLENVTTDMIASTATYALTARTIDILSAVMRTTATTPDQDKPMARISIEEYNMLPDKTVEGIPDLYAVTRGTLVPTIHMYPVPNSSTLDFVAWQIRYMEDVGTAIQDPDIPQRFLPALIYRLAYELSLKKRVNTTDPEIAREDRFWRAELGARAQVLFDSAREEDSDAASLFIRPNLRGSR